MQEVYNYTLHTNIRDVEAQLSSSIQTDILVEN